MNTEYSLLNSPLAAAYIALSNLFVLTHAHGGSSNKLEQLMEVAELSGRHKGVVLFGPSGAGKTTQMDRLEAWVNRRYGWTQGEPPLLVRASMPATCTPASLSKTLLEALGDPFAEKGSGVDAERRLLSRLPSSKAKAFAFDEFHHVFDEKPTKDIKGSTQTLKNFVSAANRPVILLGLESITTFVRNSKELKNRFSQYIELPRFALGNKEQLQDFLRLLNGIADVLSMAPEAALNESIMRLRMWLASEGGLTGALVELAKVACQTAMAAQADCVSMTHLSEAYRTMGNTDDDPFVLTPTQIQLLASKRRLQKPRR
jgi:hypothetical protein